MPNMVGPGNVLTFNRWILAGNLTTMKRAKVLSAITKATELPDEFLKVVEKHVSV